MPAAQRAIDAVDANIAVADPPAMGAHRQVYTGFATLAFLDEEPGWNTPTTRSPEGSRQPRYGRGAAGRSPSTRSPRRRNPFFWIDRALRALLMIPAYLVGLIVGESTVKIDRSAWGLPLQAPRCVPWPSPCSCTLGSSLTAPGGEHSRRRRLRLDAADRPVDPRRFAPRLSATHRGPHYPSSKDGPLR
jgi:hypothetical protein